MELICEIVSAGNMNAATRAVRLNKGASGVDGMSTEELDVYLKEHRAEIIGRIMQKEYKPQPVRRVYIPKPNGKQRPLGIPTVVDRTIQQAIAQILSPIYELYFSEYSYGFRPNRDCHMAIGKVLEYLNEGYEWVIDLDIQKYFDTVNHDKLISILRERVNDSTTLHLIRAFLKAGVMENGLTSPTAEGVPQGGPLSPLLSNIYLDKLDKELEARGLHFTRYADDCNIFVKSEKAAERVMKSVVSWLERKLFLKVNAEKTRIVRPMKSTFLGFTFWKGGSEWKCKPADDRVSRLYAKVKEVTLRKKAVARPLAVTFTKLNQIIKGWINYFRIGSMKLKMEVFGQWLRHKVRVVIVKQWKNTSTIYKNLSILNRICKCKLDDEVICEIANSRLGWYKRCGMDGINYLLNPKILSKKTKSRPGLVDPLNYYLSSLQRI